MDARSRTAARVHEIAPFHVMEVQTTARALEAAGRSVIHMEIGEPDFPTPEPVLAAALAGIAGGGIYYTSALGLPELRRAIAGYYDACYGTTIAPERIVVTAGSSAALLLTLALLVNRDDQILAIPVTAISSARWKAKRSASQSDPSRTTSSLRT
jgi:aspartate/methionine/tyrosine aminotransferase